MALLDISRMQGRTRRQAERKAMFATVQCRRGMSREAVQVLDISISGARIQSLSPLRTDSVVWIRLPNLEPLQARVVWTRNFESGCEFVRPLHPAVFETLARN